jgi:arsenate reductase
MAEAFWNSLGAREWLAKSAGSEPAGYVHPLAIRAMCELDIDISQNTSQSLEEFGNQQFDLIVTVCDAAKEACPVFSEATEMLHWPFDDPADAVGSEEERMAVFRRVRDEIRDSIQNFLTI